MKKPGSATNPLWFKDAILYELHVRTFADSNADSIGDFPGLLGKLDYLQEPGRDVPVAAAVLSFTAAGRRL